MSRSGHVRRIPLVSPRSAPIVRTALDGVSLANPTSPFWREKATVERSRRSGDGAGVSVLRRLPGSDLQRDFGGLRMTGGMATYRVAEGRRRLGCSMWVPDPGAPERTPAPADSWRETERTCLVSLLGRESERSNGRRLEP